MWDATRSDRIEFEMSTFVDYYVCSRGCYRGLEGREKRKRRRSVGRIEAQRRIPEKCCDGRLRPSSVFWTKDYMRLFDIEVLMVVMEAGGRVRFC